MTTTSTSYQSTSSLLSPPPTYLSFASSSPRSGGILLNAYKSSSNPPITPPLSTSLLQHYPPRAATPNSNSSEEERNATGTPRKIRFAPLPDPRRAVAVFDDGKEVEMVEDEGTISFGGVKDASPPRSIEEQMSSSRPGSIVSTEDDEEFGKRKTRPRKGSGTWGSATKSLLSPFLAKSPTKGGFLSPDTDDGEDYVSTKLTRRTSTGGLSGSNPVRSAGEVKRKEEFLTGIPIKYTLSMQSEADNPRASHKRAISADRRRLLNGRIYGGGRNKQQKYEEPEFVEWGYGGMGSNKAAQQGKWGSVQGKTVYTSGGGEDAKGVDDEDDGSGMAWVRKRRRERELKAQQEKEEKAQKAGGQKEKENVQQPAQPLANPALGKLPASAHSSAKTTPTASTLSSAFSSRSHSPQPSIDDCTFTESATGASTPHVIDEHHYKAVSLPPAPYHHHNHHHHHKHHGEKEHRPTPPPLAPISSDGLKQKDFLGSEPGAGEVNSLQLQLTPATPVSPEHEENKLQLQQAAVTPVADEEDTDGSDSESSDDDADVEDGGAVEKKSVASSETDETESDMEDAVDKARLTSAGAGVEKVSTKSRRG
ncbi:hypothetical protein CALCODRAFT_171153 [Calocera cornea HHB12733]|uniref:Uncharacterized protein n=1 Tax=Calocera cornea HHB12733 TaxID=1353952 RepID=A0A165HTI5_9BASI|nr:hypothetical protein CALCODRAFT_171153 [Calocera cornea HHB12733]